MKKHWTPTQDAFREFLHWLDEGVDSGGGKYLELRRRLVLYFDRRNCLTADDLADETLSRVAQKLQEKGEITDLSPAHYCYVIAKFVFLEHIRRAEHSHARFEEVSAPGRRGIALPEQPPPDLASAGGEQMLDCLDRCLKKLPRADGDLILDYYQGEQRERIQRRRQTAARLGLSANALSIRACRIRAKLEACVRSCCDRD